MRKFEKTLLSIATFFILAVICASPGMKEIYAAPSQTTIIMIDNVKDTYEIGDKITATIRVSSPDGGYLQKAWCGFGYNASTMKQLSETDSQDHIWLTSDAPVKWLTGSIEFEMKTNGKAYFIAGAYSGNGVIEAYKADGSRISCPRASVVYKIGTGIYTATSDCNLQDCLIANQETGEPIKLNRDFDKNITEYWGEVPASCTQISIDAHVEQNDDTLILPENLELQDGENDITVSVQAVSGEAKDYVFHITKPKTSVKVNNIVITDEVGNVIPYDFDPNTLSYDISVAREVDKIHFKADCSSETEIIYPASDELPQGYSFKYIKAKTVSEEKTYEFYVFRELSSLSLSSLVVDTSDDIPHPFDIPFSPDQTDYHMNVTSDVRKAKISYTIANEGDMVKEDVSDVELKSGENHITITVTNGAAENTYNIYIEKDQGVVFQEDPKDNDEDFRNTKEHTPFKLINLLPIAIAAFAFILGMVGFAFYSMVKSGSEYHSSSEAAANKQERERKKRLKAMKKKLNQEGDKK